MKKTFIEKLSTVMALPHTKDAEARSRLIKAVSRLAALKGIDGISTREIALEARCNVSLISYHFGGKEALYQEAFRHYSSEVTRAASRFLTEFTHLELTRESFRQLIGSLIDYSVDLHLRYPEMQILMFRELSNGMPQTKELFNTVFFKLISDLETFVEKARKSKIIRPSVRPRAFLISIFQLVDSFFMMQRCESDVSRSLFSPDHELQEFKEHMLTIFLDGGLHPK